jgi:FAD/FMN-containing dehydrogenase
MTSRAPASLHESLLAILGREGLYTTETDVAPFLIDHRKLYHGRARAVALPRSVDQVAQLLAWCNEHRIAVVPQGGNTGYCGGATPDESGDELVVSLKRLARIRSVDALN